MEKFNDLRFIIGLFFRIVGLLLVALSFFDATDKPFGKDLNLFSGLVMFAFGGWMRFLYIRSVVKARQV